MCTIPRRITVLTALCATIVGTLHAQAPKPVPGRPFQYWDVLEVDGTARKVYFRNDGTIPITITDLVIVKCDNTRQMCGTYPANVVVQPGKTVVAFRVEQLDRKAGWSFGYSFHTTVLGLAGLPQATVVRAPDGTGMQLRQVAIDSLAPAVAAWTDGASCGRVVVQDLPAGHRALMMVFGTASQPTARQVMVRLDANGSPYDYSDIRRDPNDTSSDPRHTQISLDLMRQTAMVRNTGGGQPATLFRAVGPTLLTAASLGMPGETIAKMVKECGGP